MSSTQWEKFLSAYKQTHVTIVHPSIKKKGGESLRSIALEGLQKKGGIFDLISSGESSDGEDSASSCGCAQSLLMDDPVETTFSIDTMGGKEKIDKYKDNKGKEKAKGKTSKDKVKANKKDKVKAKGGEYDLSMFDY